jgi:hypothetical protein
VRGEELGVRGIGKNPWEADSDPSVAKQVREVRFSSLLTPHT